MTEPYNPQQQFALTPQTPKPSPWFRNFFTTENFLESALYGATGYKSSEQAGDNILGMITGEVAGFIPYTAGASRLLKGIGFVRGATKSAKPVLNLIKSKAGRQAVEKAGARPSNRLWHAFRTGMGYEVAFQGTKLATGAQLDDYETSPEELDQKLLLYPLFAGAGSAAMAKVAPKVYQMWRGHQLKKDPWTAPVDKKTKGLPPSKSVAPTEKIDPDVRKWIVQARKSSEAVRQVRQQEAAVQKTLQEEETADALLTIAGVKPAQRNLLDEGVIEDIALKPNSAEVARDTMKTLLKEGNPESVSKASWNQLADEAIESGAKTTARRTPPKTMEEMLAGEGRVFSDADPAEMKKVLDDMLEAGDITAEEAQRILRQQALRRVGRAVDESERYKQLVMEKLFSRKSLWHNFWGQTAQWNKYMKKAVKDGEITTEDARRLQAYRSATLRVVSTSTARTERLEKAVFEDLLPEEDRLLNVLIVSDGTIDSSKRWLANQESKQLAVYAQRLPSGDIADRRFIDEIAEGVKQNRLSREDAGGLTEMIEKGLIDRTNIDLLNPAQRAFVRKFLGSKELDTAGVRVEDWQLTQAAIRENYPHLAQRADEYFKIIREETLDRMDEMQLIDRSLYEHLMDDRYLRRRFLRIADDTLLKEGDDEKLLENFLKDMVEDTLEDTKVMNALRGGSGDLLDFDARTLARYAIVSTERAVTKNELGREILRVMDIEDIASKSKFARLPKAGEKLPIDMSELRVILPRDEAGKVAMGKVWINRQMAEGMEDWAPELSHMAVQFFSWGMGGKPLRAGATAWNPGFAAVNVVRDAVQSYVASTIRSKHLPIAAMQGLDDMRATMRIAWREKGVFNDFARRSGVQGPFEAGFGERSMQTFDEFVKKGPAGQRRNVRVRKTIRTLEKLSAFSEWWLRLANFRRALKNQATKQGVELEDLIGNVDAGRMAAHEANRIIDFQDAGTITKLADQAFSPYLSAATQGTRSVIRAAGEDPLEFAWKVGQLGSLATIAYVTSRMVNPEGYKRVSDFRKANSFVIMTPLERTLPSGEKTAYYVHFPKPEIPGFNLLFDSLLRYALDGDLPSESALKQFQKAALSKGLPPTMQAGLAYFGNYDGWRNQQIWSPFRDVTAKFEFDERTSVAARHLGAATGLSPARAEVAFGKMVSNNNPWLLAVGFGYKSAVDMIAENETEREWFWNDLLDTFPFTGRFIGTSSPVSREVYRAIYDVRRSDNDRRSEINGAFDKIHNDIVHGYADWGDLQRFIRTQEPRDRRRLTQKYRFLRRNPGGANARMLSAMSGMSAEARGVAAYRVYKALPTEQRSDFLRDMRRYPGFATPEMYRAFKQADSITFGTARGR